MSVADLYNIATGCGSIGTAAVIYYASQIHRIAHPVSKFLPDSGDHKIEDCAALIQKLTVLGKYKKRKFLAIVFAAVSYLIAVGAESYLPNEQKIIPLQAPLSRSTVQSFTPSRSGEFIH